jgi:hypothetical protein
MSGQVPVLLTPEQDARKRRVNGPELALWIIGIVLLITSGVLTYSFTELILQEQTNNSGGIDLGFDAAFAQSSEIFITPFVTAGIVCIALALFMRGLDLNARRREARFVPATSPGTPIQPLTEPAADQVPVAAPAAHIPPVTDYSAFMRPSDEPADSTK